MTSVDYWLRNQNRPEHYRFTVGDDRFTVTGKDKMLAKKEALKAEGKKFRCVKLYPFSTMRNQHNFELIRNVCMNMIYDMGAGDIPYDVEKLKELYASKEKADYFFGLPLPVAWLPWEELQEAKRLTANAVEHRANACIDAGRPDLVKYC